eukprot:2649472-Pleurochrysis_carterae.AAC.2
MPHLSAVERVACARSQPSLPLSPAARSKLARALSADVHFLARQVISSAVHPSFCQPCIRHSVSRASAIPSAVHPPFRQP